MNRSNSKQLAEIVTNEQLKQMFDNARVGITDWTRRSISNKGMTMGTAWNILAKDFDVDYTYHPLSKYNMIRNFGEFLPAELLPEKKNKAELKPPIHQEPIFKNSKDGK